MIKSIGFLVFSLFLFASLADVSSGNETVLHHKTRRNHKKDDKHEYYLNRHVDHPDVDAETIKKHGASLEDAKMQADGLLEPKGKKVKGAGGEDAEATKLQEMTHGGEEKQHQRRHHRHEGKVHEEAKSSGSMEEETPKKEGIKEKKLIKNRKSVESSSESLKAEEVKITGGSNDAEAVKHTGSKRVHDKRKKGHKHINSGHKFKKHGGKKSHKPLGKPTKGKQGKKMHKNNHHN